jgi:hypothetical protein
MLHSDTIVADEIAASFDDRLRLVENVVLGKIADDREAMTAAIETHDPDREARLHALRASVHPDREARMAALRASVHDTDAPPDPADQLAVLRARVHGTEIVMDADDPVLWDADEMPIDMDLAECLQASLRARVSGVVAAGLVATSTKSWTADKRKKAASRGAAMPGGRYPISDCADVTKAVHAVGRGSGDHGKIRAHIKRRAKSLGCMEKIPDGWK